MQRLDPEYVTIPSGALSLTGHLYLPAADRTPAGVVICHGLGSRKENHADFARVVRSMGLAALAFDLRGHGESDGSLDEGVLDDVLAAMAYLSARPEVDSMRLALRGSSLGGLLSIHAAALDPRVKAVVAICPAHESLMLGGYLEPGFQEAVAQLASQVRLGPGGFARFLRSHDVLTATRQLSPRQLLLVHCRGDEVVPFALSERLFAAAGEPKQFWPLEGGSHTTAQHDPDVQLRTAEWLQQALALPAIDSP